MQEDYEKEVLRAENARLKKLTEAKSDLISVTVHQLRTRLTAFKWLLKMLLDKDSGPLTEEQERLVKEATDDTEQSLAIASDVLTVNKLENGSEIYTYTVANVSDIIREVLEMFESESIKKNVSTKCEGFTPTMLSVDIAKLRIVFENLIENALKYTPSGGTVTITQKKTETAVVFEITDTGIGIPLEEQTHLFEKFYRASNGREIEHVGSGLGLYTAKEILKNHGGNIWFESTEGKGTTFFVSLPTETAD